MNKADFDGAIKALSEIATNHTASVHANDAKLKLAYAYFLKGDYTEAIKILTVLAVPNFPMRANSRGGSVDAGASLRTPG